MAKALTFDKRVNRISRKNRKLARGYTTRIDSTGLIRPQARRARMRIPLSGILLVVMGFLCFKGFLLAHLGAETYAKRVAVLQAGSAIEGAGAWAMQEDFISVAIAHAMGPMLR